MSTNPHMSGVYHLAELRGRQGYHSRYSRHLLGWIIVQSVCDNPRTQMASYRLADRWDIPLHSNFKLSALGNSSMPAFLDV